MAGLKEFIKYAAALPNSGFNWIASGPPTFHCSDSTPIELKNQPNLGILIELRPSQESINFIRDFSQELIPIPFSNSRMLVFSNSIDAEELALALSEALTSNLYQMADSVYSAGYPFDPTDLAIAELNQLLDLKLIYERTGSALQDFNLFNYRLLTALPLKFREELALMSQTKLKKLSPELSLTLKVFTRNSLSPGKTAKDLFIHRNTLKYRLDRIYQLTGIDPRTHSGSMQLILLITLEEMLTLEGE